MKLIYSVRRHGVPAEYGHRNPKFFHLPEKRVEEVVVEGDFPHIVEAYEAIGVEVKSVSAARTGRSEQDEEYFNLVAEYEERFGQKPHPKAKAETIRQKLAETE